MSQHELLSKFTVDQFMDLVCCMEVERRLAFADDDDRDRSITATLRLFQHDLRVGVTHERQ
jgi:hypothetical protein